MVGVSVAADRGRPNHNFGTTGIRTARCGPGSNSCAGLSSVSEVLCAILLQKCKPTTRTCSPDNMRRSTSLHPDILHAALTGLEAQKQKIEQQIAEIRAIVHGVSVGIQTLVHPPKESRLKRVKRTISAEARKRISAAQKKRWAAFRKAAKE